MMNDDAEVNQEHLANLILNKINKLLIKIQDLIQIQDFKIW